MINAATAHSQTRRCSRAVALNRCRQAQGSWASIPVTSMATVTTTSSSPNLDNEGNTLYRNIGSHCSKIRSIFEPRLQAGIPAFGTRVR